MLALGLLLLGAGLLSLLSRGHPAWPLWVATGGFGAYGLVQAIVYRRNWRAWSALIVYNVPLIALAALERR